MFRIRLGFQSVQKSTFVVVIHGRIKICASKFRSNKIGASTYGHRKISEHFFLPDSEAQIKISKYFTVFTAAKELIFSGCHAEAIGLTSSSSGDTMVSEMAAKISAMAAWPDPSSHWADVPGKLLLALFNA